MACAQQHLLDARRGAWDEDGVAGHQSTKVEGMEAVHVLVGVYGVQHSLLIDVLRQRELHQDAMELWVGVQLLHQVDHLALERLGRKVERLGIDARLVARTALVADVHR